MSKRVMIVVLLLAAGIASCDRAAPTSINPAMVTRPPGAPSATPTIALASSPVTTASIPVPPAQNVPSQSSPTAETSQPCPMISPQSTSNSDEPISEWTCEFYGAPDGSVSGVVTDAEGDAVVAGTISGEVPGLPGIGGQYSFVRQFRSDGTNGWTDLMTFGRNTVTTGIATDAQGNIYVVGGSDGVLPGQASAGDTDVFVRQYHADGSEGWSRQFGTHNRDMAAAVAVDAVGNVYVAATINGELTGQGGRPADLLSDAIVRQYHADGTVGWDRQFLTNESVRIYDAAVDAAGNLYVVSRPDGVLNDPNDDSDWVIRQYHADGTEGWVRSSTASDAQGFDAFAVDAAGNLYTAVSRYDYSQHNYDSYVRQYLQDGSEGWTRWVERNPVEQVTGLTIDGENNVYLTLAVVTSASQPAASNIGESGALDVMVFQLPADGSKGWTYQMGTTQNDIARAAVDLAGNVYLAGHTWGGTVSGQPSWKGHFFLVKLRPPHSAGS